MTDTDKLAELRVLCGLTSAQLADNSLTYYLDLAKGVVMRKLYPLVTDDFAALEFPSKYDLLQVQIANELVAKIGSEGENSHNENGVNRSYGDAFVSKGLLKQITPYGAVFGNSSTLPKLEAFSGDGVTTNFTLSRTPYELEYAMVDGADVDVAVSGNTIICAVAPGEGETLRVRYTYEVA
jgi:hypothetical protein